MSANIIDEELADLDYARWTTTCRMMMLRIARGELEGAHSALRNFCTQPRKAQATLKSPVTMVFDPRIALALERGGYYDIESVHLEDDETILEIQNLGPTMLYEIRLTIDRVILGTVMEFRRDIDEQVDEELCVRPKEITIAPVKRAKGGQDWTQLEAKVYMLVKSRGPHTAAQLGKACGVHSISVGKAVAASGRLEKRGDDKVHIRLS